MLLKINKPLSKLKIGIVGSRSDCFSSVLEEKNIKYKVLKVKEIDESYDLILESGLYRVIPDEILKKPKIGIIGTHETPLPEGRGFAPIQWSVLNKREHLVITLYKLNIGVDDGEIINQVRKPIAKLEIGRLVLINKCKIKWCKVTSGNYSGWIIKSSLWGKT